MLSFLLAQGAMGSEPLNILQRETGSPQSPPYFWVDTCSGEIRGAIPHLLKHAANNIGRQLNWVNNPAAVSANYQQSISFRRAILQRGTADLVLSAQGEFPPTDWVTSSIAVAEPVIEALVATDNAQLASSDLASLRGGLSDTGNSQLQRLQKRYRGLQRYDSHQTITQMLVEGKLDYIVMGQYQGKWAQRMLDGRLDQAIKRLTITHQRIHITAFRDSQSELLIRKFDQALLQALDSGYADHINNKYFQVWLNTPEHCRQMK